ncbi:hypothetical protein FO519_006687 [Halicephalobus sp. NKZ332]|nr:hypothetical protein FO519_006687 [Halicephalobus sp. NKZ332]
MFNYVSDTRRTLEYADKVEEQQKSSMFDPEAILKAISGKEETQTSPPSLMEKLFEPFIAPVKREMSRIKATTPSSIFADLFPTPQTPVNSEAVRRAEPQPPAIPKPFVSLYPDITKPETWFKHPPETPPVPSLIPVKKDPEPLKLDDLLPTAPVTPQPETSGLQPLKLSDPFTVNPLMAFFTTPEPVKMPVFPELKGIPVHKVESLPIFHRPIMPLRDPFYNPLFPNRKSKLFDFLTGGALQI